MMWLFRFGVRLSRWHS